MTRESGLTMGSKIMFAVLVIVIAGAITAAVIMEPGASQPADDSAAKPTAAVLRTSGPRADVQQTAAPVGLDIGDRAPDWTLKDAHGQTHQLQDYLGQVVVMDFWATWCGPCKAVMPDLQQLHEDYESRGVKVIGMNGSERGGNPVKFMQQNEYTYGMLLNSESIMRQYAVRGIPAIYVVGVDGSILFKHVGVLPELDAEIARVIAPHLEKHGL